MYHLEIFFRICFRGYGICCSKFSLFECLLDSLLRYVFVFVLIWSKDNYNRLSTREWRVISLEYIYVTKASKKMFLEDMSEEWNVRLICPLHEKRDKKDWKNYWGISLFNIAYRRSSQQWTIETTRSLDLQTFYSPHVLILIVGTFKWG